MSARELNEAMGGLPAGRWGVADIERVLDAAGRSLGPDEQRLLVRLLEDAGDRLDDDGAARLKTALRRRSRASV